MIEECDARGVQTKYMSSPEMGPGGGNHPHGIEVTGEKEKTKFCASEFF